MSMDLPASAKEMWGLGPQREFTGESLREVALPLGGIGTGTISIGGRGNLRDFEIFGAPAKGKVNPFTFFALWAKPEGGEPVSRVLEGRIPAPFRQWMGEPQNQLQGLPRFADVRFRGEYPKATLSFNDPKVPVEIELTAWNPFIPQNVADSALPIAIFEWTVKNPTQVPVELSICGSLSNPSLAQNDRGEYNGRGSINEFRSSGGLRGVYLHHPKALWNDSRTISMAIATPWEDGEVQTRWYRGGWWDNAHIFWDDWSRDGKLMPVTDADPSRHGGDVASVVMRVRLEPGESATLPIYLAWHYPHITNPWSGDRENDPKVLPTYMGSRFSDAWAVIQYAQREIQRLKAETNLWMDAMFDSTLPPYVVEAVSSQASIMRTPTCFLLADGSFFGWEGCSDHAGCCHGNCTHVWNYEQAVAFLFPELERTMRRTEFIYNTAENGRNHFRTNLPLGTKVWRAKPCADGQMGIIIQLYRDWQISGDDAFLAEMWPKAKAALEYAWTMTPDNPAKEDIDCIWDLDKDGIIEGEQHNTYDIEFYGPNTMCTAMYLGALKAAEAMADYLGEADKAREYRQLREAGARKVDETLFNGEYYIQQVKVIDGVTVPEHLKSPEYLRETCSDPECACKRSPGGKKASLNPGEVVPKYQYGEGCLSDQLLGQWASHVAGLGYILDEGHVKSAMKSVFESNFMASFAEFGNVQRVYGLNDEGGLLLCTWPRGNRPLLPFVYSDEVWTGIEYHVAAHLIYEGFVQEGLTIVKAITERYSGHNRNPWNEIECGHHYARAMASWSVKLALDGFTYSVPEKRLGFAPKLDAGEYRTLWSLGSGWGRFAKDSSVSRITVSYGFLELKRLDLAGIAGRKAEVTGPAGVLEATVAGDSIILASSLRLNRGETLEVRIS